MLAAVAEGVEGLRRAFPDSQLEVREDGAGGAYVIVEPVSLGPKFAPQTTWIGGHISPQYPYADIYPLFIGGEVRLANGAAFVPPITPNHNFSGRPALQVSRRTNRLEPALQTAVVKFQKVLHWLTHQV